MQKIENTRNEMEKKNVDVLILVSEPNIRYLTNKAGLDIGCMFILPFDKEPFIMTYPIEKTRAETTDFEVCSVKNNIWKELNKVLKEKKIQKSKFGYENTLSSIDGMKRMQKFLKGKFIKFSESMLAIRLIKDKDEIKNISKSAKIAEKGLKTAREVLRTDMKERELAAEIEYSIRKAGGEHSFNMIVASGPNSAMPHSMSSERKIKSDDFVTIDLGAMYNSYNSDMTRTLCLKPDRKKIEIYKTVLEAQKIAVEKIKLNARTASTARSVDNFLKSKNYEMIHGLGHGVGIEIHEDPWISLKSKHVFKSGMVFTIEPGIYIKGYGGVRIEDMFLLTKKGIKNLTKAPKELIP